MGVPRNQLPDWDDIQLLTAQLYKPPLLDDVAVGTGVIIRPNAKKSLKLEIPLFVSDMSYDALSETAKVALAKGAELAGTVFAPEKVACCLKSRRSGSQNRHRWSPAGDQSTG